MGMTAALNQAHPKCNPGLPARWLRLHAIIT